KKSEGLSRAGTLTGCGDEYERRRDPLTDAPSFVRSEKERPIFFNRPAKRSAKLVLIEFRLVAGNPVYSREAVGIGVQHRVPEELIEVPMNIIGPRLCYYVDHRAGVAAVFGIEGIGEDAEFMNTDGTWLDGR